MMHGAYTHDLVPSYLEDSRLEQSSPTASWHTIWTMLQQQSGHREMAQPSPPIFSHSQMVALLGPQECHEWISKWSPTSDALCGLETETACWLWCSWGMCIFQWVGACHPCGPPYFVVFFLHVTSQYSSKLCSEHRAEWKTWEVTAGSFAWGQTWGLSLCLGGQRGLEHGSRNSRFIQPRAVGGHSDTIS